MNCATFVLHMSALRKISIHLADAKKKTDMKVQRSRMREEQLNLDYLSDSEFFTLYRMRKRTFAILHDQLQPHLRGSRYRSGIQTQTKALAALRFLAQGSYQKAVGNDSSVNLTQPSVSKVLEEVVDAINEHLCPKYITFPTQEDKIRTKTWFSRKHGIPNVIGVIDGTQIGVFPPSTKKFPEHIYVNRKGFHSVNVQLIIDHRCKIINVLSKFSGSTHDSYIWRMSAIRQHLEGRYVNTNSMEWILGDSGYPLEPWLLTPFSNPADDDEAMYNEHFCSLRSIVERAIGMLKTRWRCLRKERALHYEPNKAGKIVNACAVLHNICILEKDNLLLRNVPLNDEGNEANLNQAGGEDLFGIGNQRRNYVIAHLHLFRGHA